MNFSRLRGKMAEKGYSQGRLALALGITPQALNAKLNNRSSFTLDQAVAVVEILELDDPSDIFFAPNIPNMQRLARPQTE